MAAAATEKWEVKMKKTIILLALVLLYVLFSPNYVFADYAQYLDACNKILSKSSSDEYCTIRINAPFEGNVGISKVVVSNAYIYPESGVAQATKFLEEKYKSRLKQWQTPSEDDPLTTKDREIMSYIKVIEEAGPDNMKFLIKQFADEGFYTIGKNIVYDYRSYLYMQQGPCVIVMDGIAGKGYVKNQNNRYDDVDGDIEKLKKESIVYMSKVGSDVSKYCRKDIIEKETPTTQALIDKHPKENDFQKIPESDFAVVYPTATDSASLIQISESVKMTSETKFFLGVVGSGGKVLVKFPNGDEVPLEEKQAIGTKLGDLWKEGARFFNTSPQNDWKGHVTIREVDCHILLEQERQNRETLQRLGEIRSANRYDLSDTLKIKSVGDCSYINEGGPVRVLTEQGKVSFKTPGNVVVSAEDADFGIGFDTRSSTSIVEVYNGSVMVANKSGQSKNIATVYGSKINRIEVNKDGIMAEKIAIPHSEWEAFLARQQKKTESDTGGNVLPVLIVIIVLGMGGTTLFLHQKGELLPLYKTLSQKISGLSRKTNSKNPEKEEN